MKRSYWLVSYGGPHFGVFMKKLQRLMKIQAIDITTSVHNSKNGKQILTSFLLEHQVDNWPELVVLTLQAAQIIATEWKVALGSENGGRTMSGYYENSHRALSDMHSMHFKICESQVYQAWV